MNPKETTEYIKLREAVTMFLQAEFLFRNAKSYGDLMSRATRLDAARSVLWDVINDKDLTKQS